MTLENISNIGEFLGGIGVLITLVYLGVQVRQNTLAQRSESRLNTIRTMTDWYTIGMQDPEIIRLLNDGFLQTTDLSREDRARFLWMMGSLSSRIEEIYSQHKVGLIEDNLWNKYRGILAVYIQNPVVAEWWASQAAPFSDDFREAIESTPEEFLNYDVNSLNTIHGTGMNIS